MEEFINVVIECGTDANCTESSWVLVFDTTVNENRKRSQSILHKAIDCNLVEVVKLLLKKGANVNQPHLYYTQEKTVEKIEYSQGDKD